MLLPDARINTIFDWIWAFAMEIWKGRVGLMSPPRFQQASALNRRKYLLIMAIAMVVSMAAPAAFWLREMLD